MNLEDVEMRRILPSVIRGDPYHVEMSKVVDDVAKDVWDVSRLLTVWDRIDDLPEELLDALADALHIEWYDTGAPIETKRDLVKNSDLVHAKKGTVAAVESVINSYFGSGEVQEWFEYGGDPYHFKVFTENPTLVNDNLEKFMDLLGKVKRHSAKLDTILVGLTGNETAYAATALQDHTYSITQMGDERIFLYGHVGVAQEDWVEVRMTEL